ncbi:uncharacterized protein LOC118312310 isoform X2 [Scophthalmus maximus]|uniref:Uncharacterized protein n=2 Tax=Scophthalmus maximus TaxID=52904 RepID=A0A6A4T2T9_SCOMX|nr:uncharacterized protein LOC118312310 isoform X2 [Scophthalmus maximus]KAF0037541.1 hypothetical protein F2P81_010415 [Scophthalmus maximus]
MPLNSMNFKGGRGGTRRNTCKVNGQVNGQVPGTVMVNGTDSHNDLPATADTITESPPAGVLNGTKPQYVVNGYVNQRHRGKSMKAAAPRTIRKQGGTVTDAAAGRISSRDISEGVSLNGATSSDTVALPSNSDKTAPEACRSEAAAKNQSRRKKFTFKKRDTDRTTLHRCHHKRGEDWESEIQEVTLTGWEKICFGTRPYGPEDVLHFALRDLTIQQTEAVDLPVTANYSPAAHHPAPVSWSSFYIPTEQDQFADAEE